MSNPNSCLKYFKSLKAIVTMPISCRSIEVSGRREVSLSNSIATTFINTFNIITHSVLALSLFHCNIINF